MNLLYVIVSVITLKCGYKLLEAGTLQNDAELSKRIVGNWIEDAKITDYSVHGIETYSSNLCFMAIETVVDHGKTQIVTTYGVWEIKDSILKATITNEIGIVGKPAKYFQNGKIVHVDEDFLIIQPQGLSATTFTYKRSK